MKYIIMILLIAGCASMSKQQCMNANWGVLGEQDGSVGSNKLEVYMKSCSKEFTAAKQKEYKDGHLKGMANFCSFEKGKALGTENKPLPTNCPDVYMVKMREGHLEGMGIFCSYDRGVAIGRDNLPMPTVCPAVYIENFRKGYLEGKDQYFAAYCSIENGHRLGLEGKEFPQVCPSKYVSLFTKGYNFGAREYQDKKTISNLTKELQRQKDICDTKIRDMEQALSGVQRQMSSQSSK